MSLSWREESLPVRNRRKPVDSICGLHYMDAVWVMKATYLAI